MCVLGTATARCHPGSLGWVPKLMHEMESQAEKSWEVSLLCQAGVEKTWAWPAPEREHVPIPSSSHPQDAQMLRQGRDLARNQPGFASLLPPLLPWQNFLQRRSILPRRGLLGIACAVFMAVLIKYALQSVPHMTLLPETRLGCDVPSPSRNVTAAVLGNF